VAVIGLTIEQKDFQLYAMHTAGALEVIGKENAMAELPGAIQRAVTDQTEKNRPTREG
jgi:hypothetical protein